ncbi:MAG: cell envelope integrity protein TolA [Deltaproteobacteria bacterium]|nr:cell envelope integrity protein TolA [Deltaproteobacteria bacterium]
MTSQEPYDSRERPDDNRLSRMVACSAILHLLVITAIIITATRNRFGQPPPVTYTVALVDPAALGTSLPPAGKPSQELGGEKPAPVVKEPPAAKNEAPKVVQPPQPKEAKEPPPVVKKDEPKVPPPPKEKETVKLPDKEKPAEKPPPNPEKAKTEEKKPEIKPQPQQAVTKPEEKKPQPAKAEPVPPSDEEREKQIASAIEKIKGKVQTKEKDPPGAQPSGTGPSGSGSPGNGSGPTTLGGAPGPGGGGIVRGLEFIMYTEQVKRRVKESWIVAEKKPGLTATVRFGVQPDGEVVAIELVKHSGDRAFDDSVVRAVNKANPLPPPPQAYQQEFATQKVEVIFGGEEHTN